MTMNEKPKQIWVGALRGDEYVQAREAFIEDGMPAGPKHCCLAVLSHEACKTGEVPGVRWNSNTVEVLEAYDAEGDEWVWVTEAAEAKDLLENGEEWNVYDVPENAKAYRWSDWNERGDGSLPELVQEWAGLDSSNPEIGTHRAIAWNDSEEASFTKIADLIEEHL